ncbi:hypothetical protein [Desulfobulbus oligotrophicus]|uniref:Quinohemoprotein amine dehydrogenase alpha subunit haem binding domain-containing protein n=1 Tax=Desulfobulbus oligotrophicus TaxID=1909699 RepID=A0A7T5VB27_9BACT|nr:hypothetical protein [Desulfobulbus oligotrophicus]MDY0390956.1 hypothetical protein [Desulfobulbus oligotrophicus]QQG64526.1 hypothetical protein HP555_00975 [Desulfobulbus oligotrophicus]
MRRMQKIWTGLLFTLIGSLAAGSVLAEEGCKNLLQNRCASCHQVNYICPKMESNSGVIYWKWVMHTMIKEGAELSDQESAQLVTCLSSRDSQARSLCPEKP